MRVSRSFVISSYDENLKSKIIAYWERRGAKFTQVVNQEMHARRGNLFGNLTSLNMSKLKTDIVITLSENVVTCTLNIITLFQHITNWNRDYWDLELETFESFLVHDDLKEQEWQELSKRSRKKDIFATLAIMVITGLATFYIVTNLFEDGILDSGNRQGSEIGSIETTKIVSSADGAVQLTVPKDWQTMKDLNEEATLQIGNLLKDKYLVVLSEPKVDENGSPGYIQKQ